MKSIVIFISLLFCQNILASQTNFNFFDNLDSLEATYERSTTLKISKNSYKSLMKSLSIRDKLKLEKEHDRAWLTGISINELEKNISNFSSEMERLNFRNFMRVHPNLKSFLLKNDLAKSFVKLSKSTVHKISILLKAFKVVSINTQVVRFIEWAIVNKNHLPAQDDLDGLTFQSKKIVSLGLNSEDFLLKKFLASAPNEKMSNEHWRLYFTYFQESKNSKFLIQIHKINVRNIHQIKALETLLQQRDRSLHENQLLFEHITHIRNDEDLSHWQVLNNLSDTDLGFALEYESKQLSKRSFSLLEILACKELMDKIKDVFQNTSDKDDGISKSIFCKAVLLLAAVFKKIESSEKEILIELLNSTEIIEMISKQEELNAYQVNLLYRHINNLSGLKKLCFSGQLIKNKIQEDCISGQLLTDFERNVLSASSNIFLLISNSSDVELFKKIARDKRFLDFLQENIKSYKNFFFVLDILERNDQFIDFVEDHSSSDISVFMKIFSCFEPDYHEKILEPLLLRTYPNIHEVLKEVSSKEREQAILMWLEINHGNEETFDLSKLNLVRTNLDAAKFAGCEEEYFFRSLDEISQNLLTERRRRENTVYPYGNEEEKIEDQSCGQKILKKHCMLCFGEFEETLSANCGHEVCIECLQNMVSNSDLSQIKCLAPLEPLSGTSVSKYCGKFYPRELLKAHCPDYPSDKLMALEKLKTLSSLQAECSTDSEVESCHTRGCPNFYVLHSDDDDEKCKKCEACQESFCFNCHLYHEDSSSCDDYREWLELNSIGDKWSAETIKKTTKKCPNCKASIEKNKGCNHMTCKKCSHEFYWESLKPYKR